VIIPARNEAEHLPTALETLASQMDLQGRPLDPARYEVILLLNNCTDDSATIAHQFAAKHPRFVLHIVERVLSPEQAYVGRLRQLLMDEAYRRLCKLNRSRGVIASTDGDSFVDSTWVAAILSEIGKGADAMGGRIVPDPVSRMALDRTTKAYYLRSVGYHSLIAELES
jgi:glycosyltransferase involved in cell wall biosynthesis